MNHKLIHSDEKPFECSDCSYAARTKKALRKHQRIHTNDYELYECSQCSYAARSQLTLNNHARTHYSAQQKADLIRQGDMYSH
jgi:hypothetical protein